MGKCELIEIKCKNYNLNRIAPVETLAGAIADLTGAPSA